MKRPNAAIGDREPSWPGGRFWSLRCHDDWKFDLGRAMLGIFPDNAPPEKAHIVLEDDGAAEGEGPAAGMNGVRSGLLDKRRGQPPYICRIEQYPKPATGEQMFGIASRAGRNYRRAAGERFQQNI